MFKGDSILGINKWLRPFLNQVINQDSGKLDFNFTPAEASIAQPHLGAA
jgi:hypothetical protein